MKVLLKQAKIVCPTSSYNGQTKDILIEQGIIISINDNIIDSTATIISNEGLQVSIGWRSEEHTSGGRGVASSNLVIPTLLPKGQSFKSLPFWFLAEILFWSAISRKGILVFLVRTTYFSLS